MQGFPLDVAAVLRACTAKQLIVAGGQGASEAGRSWTRWGWMRWRGRRFIRGRWEALSIS